MELSKNYNPASIEEKWNKHWLEKGYFKASQMTENLLQLSFLHQNVTGVLHMGHTLNETVQDILVRRARMSGYNACWVPGSDHASIATEARVVNMLKEKGIDKNDLTRDEFLKYAYEWKEKYGNIIYSQIEKLGCSVDWDRVNFTMDEHYYKAVIKVFVELYNKGLIYRGARMINWDPSAKTALSDEEVEYKEVTGKLYYVRYKIVGNSDDNDFIAIATQRPETIMGDTAVCVNPNDDRYAHLKGKKVIVPLVDREVPIIFDEYVDSAFGTGALKVTPAHDINDYNLGLKHKLERIEILDADGKISSAAQIFVGLDRFEARRKVIEILKSEDLLIKEEDYITRVGYSQRTGVVIEPHFSLQWFVSMKDLSQPALDAVLRGEIKIHPNDKFLATYKYWLENVKDWCISRQLWWGQQIPAWYGLKDLKNPKAGWSEPIVAENDDEARKKFFDYYISKGSSIQEAEYACTHIVHQDKDVLDTWFSSWLWPIEVFNGITEPDNKDFNYYYPTSVLVTGQDIIFFWVARMIMAGYEFKNQKPFSDVYFTGMVRDKQGRKMSKSLGNSPDLLELIGKYGADAVRFGIMISSPAGNDLLFDESSLEQGRNFNNKLWNALKLVKNWELRVQSSELALDNFATDWFENRLNEAKKEIENLFKDFKLSEALKILYSLIWDDFCSWYLEWAKPGFEQPISKDLYDKTVFFFEELLQLLHPFTPFISEEIFHLLKEQKENLCVKQYSRFKDVDIDILKSGNLLKERITTIRDARNKQGLKLKDKIDLIIDTEDKKRYKSVESLLKKQLNISEFTIINEGSGLGFGSGSGSGAFKIVVGQDKIYIITGGWNDLAEQKQIAEMKKDLEYQKGFLQSVLKKLSNEKFVQNAKPEVLAFEQKKKADAEEKIKVLEESLANL